MTPMPPGLQSLEKHLHRSLNGYYNSVITIDSNAFRNLTGLTIYGVASSTAYNCTK